MYNKKVFVYKDIDTKEIKQSDYHCMLEFNSYEEFDNFQIQYAKNTGIFHNRKFSWVSYEYLENNHKDIFDMFIKELEK